MRSCQEWIRPASYCQRVLLRVKVHNDQAADPREHQRHVEGVLQCGVQQIEAIRPVDVSLRKVQFVDLGRVENGLIADRRRATEDDAWWDGRLKLGGDRSCDVD